MRTTFHSFLPNGLGGDPTLWVDVLDEGHSLLFDAGDLSRLPTRKLLRVERVVITHTHMDHFMDFDRLLRVCLGRSRELVITGPPGFLRNVQGKIDAYTWNLIEDYPLQIVAEEIDGGTVRGTRYRGAGRMRPEPLEARPFLGTLCAQRSYTITAALLEHGVPVLGLGLRETEHLAVDRDGLERLGLVPGAWLSELKHGVRRGLAESEPIEAAAANGPPRHFPRGELAAALLRRTPGQKIAYLTDVRHTPENLTAAIELARGVDLLICESAFLHADAALASERGHLTARQAGELARAAGAERLAPFHISPRYQGREQELLDEAAEAFGRPVLVLPRGGTGCEAGTG